MVDFGPEIAKPHLPTPQYLVSGQKGLSHLINVGVGTRNSEAISIGRS